MSMTADGLRALEGFQSLPQAAAAALAAHGRLRTYAAKQSLFREGDAAKKLGRGNRQSIIEGNGRVTNYDASDERMRRVMNE